MIVASGQGVYIRNHEPGDFFLEIIWSQDQEVVALDPPSNGGTTSYRYSICTNYGLHIGTCSLYAWDPIENAIQLGIRIGDKNYWDKGYGTEVVALLTKFAYSNFGVTKVWLKVLPDNIRAIRCYEKCQFVQAGTLVLNDTEFIVMERGIQ